MNSFVKPSARARFGLAAASTFALVAAPAVVAPANAASFTVTNCDASGAGSLAAALSSSNATAGEDVIDFSLSSDCTLTVNSTLEINDSVQIRNASDETFTLLAGNSLTAPVMSVSGAGDTYERVNLELDGLIFDGNDVTTGYALFQAADEFFQADITVRNSSFRDATQSAIFVNEQIQLGVYGSTFTGNDALYGGAISIVGTSTGVLESYFNDNDATASGGSIFLTHDSNEDDGEQLLVTGSTFKNGDAINGGAISVTADDQLASFTGLPYVGVLLIQDSTFQFNSASAWGGAIFADNATVSLFGLAPIEAIFGEGEEYVPFQYGSYFAFNEASYGGAIGVTSGSLLSLGSDFSTNHALMAGGAILMIGDQMAEPLGDVLVSYGDSFYTNLAGVYGGAIFSQYTFASSIGFGSIIGNQADTQGGGVFLRNNEIVQVVGNTIANNLTQLYAPALFVGVPDERSYEADTQANYFALVSHNTFMDNESETIFERSVVEILTGDDTTAIGGNIFASKSEPDDLQFLANNSVVDLGANLFTGPAVQLGDAGPLPSYPAPVEGGSAMVEVDLLELQTPAMNNTNPDNFSTWQTIAIGEDSVARDYYDFDSPGVIPAQGTLALIGGSEFWDGRFVARADEDNNPLYGDGFDVGAYEIGWSLDQTPIDPNVVITGVSKPTISATGDSFSVYGRGLDDVTELFIAGVKVSFRVVSANELVVTSGALPIGQAEILAIATDGRAVYQLGVGVVDEASYWTKNLGNGQAKLYAKNIVGQGKVQFFLNGKEIAWVNAIDESDPKLRKANGASYLVRTVDLVAGKNRLEVKVDGERVRFTTYSN